MGSPDSGTVGGKLPRCTAACPQKARADKQNQGSARSVELVALNDRVPGLSPPFWTELAAATLPWQHGREDLQGFGCPSFVHRRETAGIWTDYGKNGFSRSIIRSDYGVGSEMD